MNFGAMQRMTALMCGNLKAAHPLYLWITGEAATSTPSVINQEANDLVRMYPERLPEIPAAWTIGPTVAGEIEHSLVSDMIAIHKVACAHSATEPDWDTAKTVPMAFAPFDEWDVLARDDAEGYPTIWTRRGKQILIYPTPSASYIDYLRVYGLMEETFLVSSSDEFYINAAWHPVICTMAAARIEEMRGNFTRAKELREAATDKIESSKDLAGEENIGKSDALVVEGAPTRSSVYGE